MSKLNFKTISTLAIAGFLSLKALMATPLNEDPSDAEILAVTPSQAIIQTGYEFNLDILNANVPEHMQRAAIGAVNPHDPRWLSCYVILGLGGDSPIAEALHQAIFPTKSKVQEFYAWVKAHPVQDLSFSPALTQSIRVIASRYDPNVADINLVRRQMRILPHNLWGLSNITSLDLSENQIVDVSPLSRLTQLVDLNLVDNQIVDVSPLATLTQLLDLNLADNQIVDVSPLSHLTQLTWLHLDQNQIVDVSPLSHLTQLKRLYPHQNQIVDVSPLRHLTQLTWLCLHQNQIVDVAPLATLTQLTWLFLAQNQVVDVAPLAGLNELKSLTLCGNPATDRYEKQQRVQEYFTSNTVLFLKDSREHVRGTRPYDTAI